MAKRNTHYLNSQTINGGKFFQLIPVNYTEVMPGDTISGTIKSRLVSDTANHLILNRAYYDLYAFHVPYRLLWDDWPEFIADVGSHTIPTVTDVMTQNFENHLCIGGASNVAFQRRAYNHICNQFFNLPDDTTRSEHDNTMYNVPQRPSTFAESVQDHVDSPDTSIDVSGGTLYLDDLRAAEAEEQFQQIRTYYGSKYVDYLRSMGVQANWSVLEEAEQIGQKHADLPFRSIKSSDGANTGNPAGGYDGVTTLNLKPTYCMEHGLVAVYAVARIDTINRGFAGPPLLVKNDRTMYFSPEYQHENEQLWEEKLFGSGNLDLDNWITPKFDDYRKGCNMISDQTIVDYSTNYIADWSS